jgi:long-chain acyl-CoA synthetase
MIDITNHAIGPTSYIPERHSSLVAFLEEALEKYKHLPMVENMGKVLTYGEVAQLTRDFAAYLQHYTSLRPGDPVAIQLPNLLQYPIALIGLLRAGMVVVNVNPLYTAHELEYQLKDATAKGIVILSNFAHNLSNIVQHTAIKTVIVADVGDLLGRFKRHVVNFTVRHVKKLVPQYNFPQNLQVVGLGQALKLGKKTPFHRVSPQLHDTAFLQYTGGTTGSPKGVMLLHSNILANIEQVFSLMKGKLMECAEIIITPLPLYHIFALIVNLLSTLQIGAKNVLVTNPKDTNQFIKILRKHPFTCLSGVNTLYTSLLSHPAFASINFSKLKLALSGGVALQEAIADRWEKLTGIPLIEGYGLTEASPCIACSNPNGPNHRGTVGTVLPHTLVKIVDEENQEVAPGQPGQLLVKGPQVMAGYWKNPEETKQVFLDGWLQTGDIATISEDGYIKLLDRKKEMINVSGFNVYPTEVENIILQHPKVLEAAAVATWEEDGKEVLKLFVVRRDPGLGVEELAHYCRQRLTNYKVPRYIEFRDELPKSPVGKTLRRVLQEEEKQKLLLN